eukprot:723633-Alexandrium_andersonii.AAC.1
MARVRAGMCHPSWTYREGGEQGSARAPFWLCPVLARRHARARCSDTSTAQREGLFAVCTCTRA